MSVIISHTTGSLGERWSRDSIFLIAAQFAIGNFITIHYCLDETYEVLKNIRTTNVMRIYLKDKNSRRHLRELLPSNQRI